MLAIYNLLVCVFILVYIDLLWVFGPDGTKSGSLQYILLAKTTLTMIGGGLGVVIVDSDCEWPSWRVGGVFPSRDWSFRLVLWGNLKKK